MDEENSDERVTWERFEYVAIPCKGSQERRKLMLVKKTTPMTELFSYFKDLLSTFPAHQFRATWQRQQLKHLTTNLPQNDCVTIHDFSENYRIASKDEIQSSYFQRTEVTLHVSILYRHATFEVDGIDSTPENPSVVTEQFLIFSNDEKHDHHFVHRAQEMIRDYLESISYRVNTMHEFTDGCPSQYKSRQCMGDIAHGCGDLGYERVIRNFFETSHAKGPQDAAGGYIKKQLDTAILRGKITINSAKDAYEYCKDNLSTLHPDSACTKRIFRYLESEGIKRQRNRNFRPIKHNRDVHKIITNGEGMLILRSHSCYSCDECACGRYELCMNKKITKPRLERMVTTDTCNTGDIEHESDFVQYSLAELVKRGDLVVIYTDDQEYDYYLLKATHGFQRLLNDESDDWNNIFPKDNPVIRGHYYNKARGNNVYVLDPTKSALISANSVICIIHELKAMSKISIPENIHEDLISWVDECSV